MRTRTFLLVLTLVACLAGSPAHAQAPPEAAVAPTTWRSVAAGAFHTCAIRSDGRLFCWGSNDQAQLGTGGPPGGDAYGQVGDGGEDVDRPAPSRVAGAYRSVDAGDTHTCAIRTSAALVCWGDDTAGQLGNTAAFASADAPSFLGGPPRTWLQVSAGGAHTCGRVSSGRAFCWGDDAAGQLGNDDVTGTMEVPVAVDTNDRFAGIGAGSGHTCARSVNGEVACWGADFSGQLGNGPIVGGTQEPVGALTPFSRQVAAGGFHSCNLTTAHRLQCWGDNSKGQVGRDSGGLYVQTPLRVDVRPT